LFGPHRNTNHQLGPTRIIVRDAFLSTKSFQDWEKSREEGVEFTEIKTETSIDRRTGIAARGSLRTQERVNAGTEFQLQVSVRVFEGDDETKILEYIKEAIGMISKDTLGGAGTRGYGWVEVKDIEVFDC
jgi:CRISPR-associated protein Csm3